MSRSRIFACFFLAAVLQSQVGAERVLVLDDFDGNRLSQSWTALGKIEVARSAVPSDTSVEGVDGMMAVCEADANAKFFVNKDFPRPPYQDYEKIRFRIRAKGASKDRPFAFEFQVFSQARSAALWRKFLIDQDAWTIVELPMQHFRYSRGASLDWTEVSRFGIHFRQKAEVAVDRIELVAAAPPARSNPYFTVAELAEFAFGKEALISENDRFAVITNDGRVERTAVLAAFDELYEMVYADFPNLPKPARKVPTLIFAKRSEYERFWKRFGALYVADVPPVRSNGYSLLGIAGTYHSSEFGPVRPVLVHEACHALLAPALGLSNSSEWLHEGLANYYQLHWSRQDIHDLNRTRIADGEIVPLIQLLDGKRISTSDYAQVTLFMKWLLDDDQRKRQLSTAFQVMRRRNSTELESISQQCFNQPLVELERGWLRWAKRNSP